MLGRISQLWTPHMFGMLKQKFAVHIWSPHFCLSIPNDCGVHMWSAQLCIPHLMFKHTAVRFMLFYSWILPQSSYN